ncbi:alkaline shock response membrane anchor protein AmaP [Cutibacterium sp. WCA-380-WT-3A]|uniref:Alkaline shock response membrane anchor protein AmaP n=1 Tax=Cutibacterium porci TaxID=2605781 RepID=A0A7K0J583_9ACTN|nr:alkaline shock response membrane anchor protein AmaP [Cutibacterium porci]MSS45072.1 alkaline shock response membrane anchor protein AmaP [Cutibacterium porci]
MKGRANRARLAVIGIIGLVVVAWFMLVRFNIASSWGWWQPEPDAPIVDVPKAWRTDYASWALLIVGALAVVIGLIWLRRQFSSSNRAHTYGISHEADHGSTVLSTDALGRAVEEQIEEFPGVSSASVRFFGARVAPEMMIQIDIDDHADVRMLADRLESDVARDVEMTLDATLVRFGTKLRTGAHVTGMGVSHVGVTEVSNIDDSGDSLPAHPMPKLTFLQEKSDRVKPRTREGKVLA